MASPRIVEIENHRLAEGGFVKVSRLGWSYQYCRYSPADGHDESGPEIVGGLKRGAALGLLADALRRDVIEGAE